MPWKATDPMTEKEEFMKACLAEGANVSELCRQHGISRKTAYKWLGAYKVLGRKGLAEKKRRPKKLQNVDGEVVLAIQEVRMKHPRWGAKTILAALRRSGVSNLPSARTVTRILERSGLLRKRRRTTTPNVSTHAPRATAERCNELWTVDFKGWWKTKDGTRCDPLTIRDAFSRFVLCAEIVERPTFEETQKVFIRVFRKNGLPEAILVDNGSPFVCTRSPAGLSRLSAWWVSLGIQLRRSRPASPQDNGAHERMHAEMAAELQAHPARNRLAQQHDCEQWRREYNTERPHHGIGLKTPSELYSSSVRKFRGPLEPTYPRGFVPRQVADGRIRWHGEQIYLSRSLDGQTVGLRWLDRSRCQIHFFNIQLGEFQLAFERDLARQPLHVPKRHPFEKPLVSIIH